MIKNLSKLMGYESQDWLKQSLVTRMTHSSNYFFMRFVRLDSHLEITANDAHYITHIPHQFRMKVFAANCFDDISAYTLMLL